jgi:molybdopterin synthase sulfur carrier subunit
MVRVELPFHLQQLAHVDREVTVDVASPITPGRVIDAIEARFPMLRGTIRDYATGERRPYLRFFACEQDLSFGSLDAPLPDPVASGDEPFLIVGALSGG